MQNEGFSTFGVQNRNYGTHKPLLRITVGIIMEKDPKCAKTLILHTTAGDLLSMIRLISSEGKMVNQWP